MATFVYKQCTPYSITKSTYDDEGVASQVEEWIGCTQVQKEPASCEEDWTPNGIMAEGMTVPELPEFEIFEGCCGSNDNSLQVNFIVVGPYGSLLITRFYNQLLRREYRWVQEQGPLFQSTTYWKMDNPPYSCGQYDTDCAVANYWWPIALSSLSAEAYNYTGTASYFRPSDYNNDKYILFESLKGHTGIPNCDGFVDPCVYINYVASTDANPRLGYGSGSSYAMSTLNTELLASDIPGSWRQEERVVDYGRGDQCLETVMLIGPPDTNPDDIPNIKKALDCWLSKNSPSFGSSSINIISGCECSSPKPKVVVSFNKECFTQKPDIEYISCG